MNLNFQIIQLSDLDDIIQFEQKLLAEVVPDEMERTMHSWKAKWRKESLEHYLPMGWSFLAKDADSKVVGYFIAQPLLFFDGNTQTLWVEHIQSENPTIMNQLIEIAYKLSREKHFQRVLFPELINKLAIFESQKWNPLVSAAWTSKISR